VFLALLLLPGKLNLQLDLSQLRLNAIVMMRPSASASRSTDSEARTVPDDRITLSSTCGRRTTPLTTIALDGFSEREGGSLSREAQDEKAAEQASAPMLR
jgi:hypothetical protein